MHIKNIKVILLNHRLFGLIGVTAFAIIGFVFAASYAVAPSPNLEAENGTISTAASSLNDSSASGGKAVKFGTTCMYICGYPDATNTGVPTGATLAPSASVTVTTAGATISGLDITGSITIKANNVTIKNCKITSNGYFGVQVFSGVSGVTVEDTEIDMSGSGGTQGSDGIFGPVQTISRVNIYGAENGILPTTGSTITDSYIHDLLAPGSPHYDAIQIDGGEASVTIKHNTIDMSGMNQDATVRTDNQFGSLSGIIVDDNILLGAGFTVYADGSKTPANNLAVTFENNYMGVGYYGGYLYEKGANTTVTWTNNVDYTTRSVIPYPG